MIVSLSTRNKIGFIDGAYTRPAEGTSRARVGIGVTTWSYLG